MRAASTRVLAALAAVLVIVAAVARSHHGRQLWRRGSSRVASETVAGRIMRGGQRFALRCIAAATT